MLEGNELIPNLKCTAPCKECMEIGGEVVDMEFCTECWQDNPKKYLYTESQYSASGSGVSICDNACPDGWTSNGDTEYHVCEPCDSSCLTCADSGNIGDKNKCITCHAGWKLYAPEQKCMETCALGYYEVNSETCDKCNWPCMDCTGDKFNCI